MRLDRVEPMDYLAA